jgi:hypothetical protein
MLLISDLFSLTLSYTNDPEMIGIFLDEKPFSLL